MSDPEPFADVTLPHGGAPHEVVLSFGDAADAELFRDWWGERGATAFAQWVADLTTE